MKKYSDYTTEDFITDSTFVDWVIGDGNKDATHFWTRWYDAHSEQHGTMQQAKDFILASRIEEPAVSDSQVENLIAQTLNKIYVEETPIAWYKSPFWLWSAAASVLLLLTFGLLDKKSQDSKLPIASHVAALLLKKNESEQKMPVKLPDGSTVLLQPQGTIRYPDNFSETATRDVYLEGQAFFEVIKNPQKPFLVHIKNVVVKVLGTSFTVQANDESKAVKVIVKTGKVMVYEAEQDQPTTRAMTLLPNQQGIVNEQHQLLASSVSEAQVQALTSHSKPTLEFSDTPVGEVFKTLEKAYGITIYFDQKLLSDCSLTTNLGDEPLFEKLQILCEAIGPNTKFELVNEKIIIQSLGCNQ